jgi:sugar phosphate isomerase/epimerase
MHKMLLIVPVVFQLALIPTHAQEKKADLFARDNLVAWCIVPFDAKKRGPEERAAMMKRLGFHRFAYDWRDEHIATFDTEVVALNKYKIELVAWWFPTSLDKNARTLLDVLKRHGIKTQLWVTGGGGPVKSTDEQQQRVKAEADRIRPIAEEAAKIGCTVALYNHGGWFGEPENQIAIIEHLKLPNVKIVYNLHHGHDHLARFPELLKKMLPHLAALNLNGMVKDGDKAGKKILPLGQGDLDLELLKTIRASGYRGPLGILGHTQDDAELRLQDNLAGIDWLLPQLDGKKAGPKPAMRTYAPAPPKTDRSQGPSSDTDAGGVARSVGLLVERESVAAVGCTNRKRSSLASSRSRVAVGYGAM